MVVVYPQNHIKPTNTLYGQSAKLRNMKVDDSAYKLPLRFKDCSFFY